MTEAVGDGLSRWRTFGERAIHEDPEIWFGQVDVGLPSRERIWQHVVRLHRAVAVVLVDDQDQVLLVWRHRFVQNRLGWELPGGLVDEDEEPREAAVRELEEQTGYRSGQLEHLITFQPVAEVVDGERVVFVGRGAQRVAEPVSADVERVEWVTLSSAVGLIAAGQIWNAASVIGLLSVAQQIC